MGILRRFLIFKLALVSALFLMSLSVPAATCKQDTLVSRWIKTQQIYGDVEFATGVLRDQGPGIATEYHAWPFELVVSRVFEFEGLRFIDLNEQVETASLVEVRVFCEGQTCGRLPSQNEVRTYVFGISDSGLMLDIIPCGPIRGGFKTFRKKYQKLITGCRLVTTELCNLSFLDGFNSSETLDGVTHD